MRTILRLALLACMGIVVLAHRAENAADQRWVYESTALEEEARERIAA